MSLAIDWQSLHLLRPWWLLALLPALWLTWRSWRAQNSQSDWSKVVDAELLPHLLDNNPTSRRRYWPLLLLTAWIIATLAISGPAWKKQPQPLYLQESALVILLDLSRSMDANDITPSRLTHARHKILDILAQRQEGQTGLVVYTDHAYVVSPLTDDNRTIANLVPALSSDIMPSQGSRLSVAIQRANKLLDDAGFQAAQLLVISDGVSDEHAYTLAKQLAAKQRTLSVLAIGNRQGSPIPLPSGGFLKDSQGAIVISKADHPSLQRLAAAGAGRYSPLRYDDSDLKTLFPANQQPLDAGHESEQQTQQQWRDEGVWLLLPLLIIGALAFRRGWLFSVLFCALLMPPQMSYAQEWDSLWQSRDQQAAKAMQQQQFQQAAEQFDDPLWRATALYRAGDYQQAAELFGQYNSADSHYNQGNALAKAGKLSEAIKAYEAALKQDPDHQDSQYNLQLLQSLMEQQQDQPSDSEQQADQGEQQAQESQQQGEQGEPQSPSGEASGEQSGEPPTPESGAEQPPSEPSPSSTEQQEASEQAEATEQPQPSTGEATESDQQQSEPVSQSELETEGEEQAQYLQQWLRRIPDDPGGLLRRKFEQQHQQQQQQPQQPENHTPW